MNEDKVVLQTTFEYKIRNYLFSDNECEYSLYILSQTNTLRIACKKMIASYWFDGCVILVIFVSTVRIIADTFIHDKHIAILAFDIIDLVTYIFFYLEFIAKVIALGFVEERGTYLSDNWNTVDFFIIILSMVDLQTLSAHFTHEHFTGSRLAFFRVFRVLRALRPLRFITHNDPLKSIVKAIIDSMESILNVLLIVLIVFIMFGVAGMKLFNSSYHTCYQMSDLYGYPLAFHNFAEMLHKNNITGRNETENTLFVNIFLTFSANLSMGKWILTQTLHSTIF